MKFIEKLSKNTFLNSIAIVALSSSTGAFSQEPDADEMDLISQLEEIVVTAQYIEQNVQDTPLAISSITDDKISARGQNTVTEIAQQAPNVTLANGGAFAGPALIGFIRGVGQTDFNPALEAGVGLYVDDIYYSTLTGSILDLLDLDRVEVLRGPQGTLAGKNSIGGAIKLYSKKPGPDQDGYLEIGYGDYDEVLARAASNFTLVDDVLYARIAGVSRARDGYVEVRDYLCTHPTSGLGLPSQVQGGDCTIGTEGGINYTAARLALQWLPSDEVEINFSTDVLNEDSEPAANVNLGTAGTTVPIGIDVDNNVGTGAIPGVFGYEIFWPVDGCLFVAYGPNSCDPNSPNDPYVNYSTYMDPRTETFIRPEQTMRSRGHSLNIDLYLTDTLKFQSITGYRTYESGFGNDPDGSPVPVQQLYQRLKHNQLSQEFRLNGEMGNWLNYTLGAFYFDADTVMDARVNLGYVAFDFIHGPDPVDSKTQALFAHAIFYPMDDLDITVGVRYTDDEKTYTFVRRNPDFSAIQPCIGPPGTPGNPPNCLISSINNVSSTFEDTRTDYRFALSYHWENVMAYTQYASGFKGGGVNPRPFYDVQVVTFAPETLDSFEIGLKSELLNKSLRLNAALFSNKYEDIQLTLNDCTSLFGATFGLPCLLNTNAGDADMTGAELEFEWYPTTRLLLDGSFATLDYEYTTIDPTTGVSIDNITPFTPESEASLGIQYDFALRSGGLITPRVDWIYQDDIFTAADNTEAGKIENYSLVNASVTWLSRDEDWQLAFELKNATDELYYTMITDGIAFDGGNTYAVPALPRTYMFKVKHSF